MRYGPDPNPSVRLSELLAPTRVTAYISLLFFTVGICDLRTFLDGVHGYRLTSALDRV